MGGCQVAIPANTCLVLPDQFASVLSVASTSVFPATKMLHLGFPAGPAELDWKLENNWIKLIIMKWNWLLDLSNKFGRF